MTMKLCDSINAFSPNTVPTLHADSRLGRAVAPVCEAHPGLCGLHILDDSMDAFVARYRLAELAERTLDVQYYIWEDDTSGRLLMLALLVAADRGVKVRLLLDDNNTLGMDGVLRQLDNHPNIEVRLFNPLSFRSLRALGYLISQGCIPRRLRRINESGTMRSG